MIATTMLKPSILMISGQDIFDWRLTVAVERTTLTSVSSNLVTLKRLRASGSYRKSMSPRRERTSSDGRHGRTGRRS